MKYPAIDISGVDPELAAALVDDFSPTAIEERDDITTIYFADARQRDLARQAVAAAAPDARISARDVDDENWARRSQDNLQPVMVGRLVITPPWLRDSHATSHQPPAPNYITLVITPSMGFGTGHHATTRLCLEALQAIDLTGRTVLDVGTGSGILAIAARMLGATEVIGVDYDPDAIQSAEENLVENPSVDRVRFVVSDLRALNLRPADVVTANLTGALLVQTADLLAGAVRGDGRLIVSGLLAHEREAVVASFAPGMALVAEREQEGWLGLTLTINN